MSIFSLCSIDGKHSNRLKNPVLKSAQDFEQYDNLILSLREMHLLGTPAPIPAMTMYTALISIVPTMQVYPFTLKI